MITFIKTDWSKNLHPFYLEYQKSIYKNDAINLTVNNQIIDTNNPDKFVHYQQYQRFQSLKLKKLKKLLSANVIQTNN